MSQNQTNAHESLRADKWSIVTPKKMSNAVTKSSVKAALYGTLKDLLCIAVVLGLLGLVQ